MFIFIQNENLEIERFYWLGSRQVILRLVFKADRWLAEPSWKHHFENLFEATVKLKVQSYKQRENEEIKKSTNQKMEMTVIQPNYQSEVLKLFTKNQQKMITRSNDTHAMVVSPCETVTVEISFVCLFSSSIDPPKKQGSTDQNRLVRSRKNYKFRNGPSGPWNPAKKLILELTTTKRERIRATLQGRISNI